MEETPLAESRSIDDQIEWQDDHRLLYGDSSSLWTVPADGSGEPRKFMSQALSPAVIRTALPRPPGDGAPPPADSLALRPTDLGVAVSTSANPVRVGEDLEYTVTVTNHGPVEATALKVDHVLPRGVTIGAVSAVAPPGAGYGCATFGDEGRVACDTARLPSGASWTISLTVTATAEGAIRNQVMVSGAEPDPNQGNDDATIETAVIAGG
jgi:uncharacterized repeat protein (TIGR01451 family)